MNDFRSLDWRYLLSRESDFRMLNVPIGVRTALERMSVPGASRVLVAWECSNVDVPPLDSYFAVIAINSKTLKLDKLRASGFGYIQRFAVLPGLREARWFVPLGNNTISAAAFELYLPFTPRAKLLKLVAQLAFRTGMPLGDVDEVVVAQRQKPWIVEELERHLHNRNPHLAISTGTTGPTRKPSIAVLDPHGNIQAIAKVADNSLARSLLAREATVLKALELRPGMSGLTPKLIHESRMRDMTMTIQQALRGKPAGSRFTVDHRRFLQTLSSRDSKPTMMTSMISRIPGRITQIHSDAVDLASIHAHIGRLVQHVRLPSTIVHGDFAPWNLRQQHGEIRAFDWEHAELDGLPLIDEIHHRLMTGFLLQGWSNEQAVDMLQQQVFESHVDLHPRQIRGLQLSYLLNVYIRRHEEGHNDQDVWKRRFGVLLESIVASSGLSNA